MRRESSVVILFVIALFLGLVLAIIPASESSSTLDARTVDQYMQNAGLPADIRIVKVNLNNPVSIDEPIIIMGSGIDAMENQVYQAVAANYQVDSSYVLNDKTNLFKGKSIENYDIVVIGGPEHNAYTKALLDRGILKYNVTGLKTSGLIVEAEKLPGGHTVLVVASVAGYPYSETAPVEAIDTTPTDSTPQPAIDTTDQSLEDDLTNLWIELAIEQQVTQDIFDQLSDKPSASLPNGDAAPSKPTFEAGLDSWGRERATLQKLNELLEKMDLQVNQAGHQWADSGDNAAGAAFSQQATLLNQMLEMTNTYITTEHDACVNAINGAGGR